MRIIEFEGVIVFINDTTGTSTAIPKGDIYVEYVKFDDEVRLIGVSDNQIRLRLDVKSIAGITGKNGETITPSPNNNEGLSDSINQMLIDLDYDDGSSVAGTSLSGFIVDQSFLVDPDLGSDSTAEGFNVKRPFKTIKAACSAAYSEYTSNPDIYNEVPTVYVKKGLYDENEVNQKRSEIYVEPGSVLINSTSGRSIFSDRVSGADTYLRVYGGRFVVASRDHRLGGDNEAFNFRNANADVYAENATIDSAQMWTTAHQRLHLNGCTIYFANSDGMNRGGADIVLERCYFPDRFVAGAYSSQNSRVLVDNPVIDLRSKSKPFSVFYDGEFLFDSISTFNGNHSNQMGEYYLASVSGSSGSGKIVVDGVEFDIDFDTDAATTINNFCTESHDASQDWEANNKNLFLFKRVRQFSVSGTSGSASITIGANSYALTFNGSIPDSIRSFCSTNGSTLFGRGYLIMPAEDGLSFYIAQRQSTGDSLLKKYLIVPDYTTSAVNSSGDLSASVSSFLGITTYRTDLLSISFAGESGDLSVSVSKMLSDLYVAKSSFVPFTSNPSFVGLDFGAYNSSGGNSRVARFYNVLNGLIRVYRPGGFALRIGNLGAESSSNRGKISIMGMKVVDLSGSTTYFGVSASLTSGLKPLVSIEGVELSSIDNKDIIKLTTSDQFTNANVYQIPIQSDMDGSQTVSKYDATVAPSITDDINSGRERGSRWYTPSDGSLWECASNATGAAVWVKIGRELRGLTVIPGTSANIGPSEETSPLPATDFITTPATGGFGVITYTIRKSSDRLITSGAAEIILTCADLGGPGPVSVPVDIVATDEIGQQVYRVSSVVVDDPGMFCGF